MHKEQAERRSENSNEFVQFHSWVQPSKAEEEPQATGPLGHPGTHRKKLTDIPPWHCGH